MSHPLTPPEWWGTYAARTLPITPVAGGDKLLDINAASAATLLRTHDEIDAEWLTYALRAGGQTNAHVESVQIQMLGTGAFDSTVRLQIDYADGSAGPSALIGKFALQTPALQRTAIAKNLFRREATACFEVFRHRACRVPPVYFAAADDENLNLLLADVDGDTSSGTLDGGCSIAEASAVLTELASLHGCFARLSPVSAPSWLLRRRDSADLIAAHYRVGLDSWLPRCGAALKPEHIELLENFADYVAVWHRFERQMLTLTHGDPRVDNVLFRYNSARCEATLLNWPLAGLRNPMHDVACLLAGSLDVTSRRVHEHQLIAHYLRVFDYSGTHYPEREALADYRFNLYSALLFSVCAAGVVPISERTDHLLLTLLQRNCTALLDWDAPALLQQRLLAVD